MFMNNNNINEHPMRLRPHKPELRGPTKTKLLSIMENMDAHKSLSERGQPKIYGRKANWNKYVLSFFSRKIAVISYVFNVIGSSSKTVGAVTDKFARLHKVRLVL